MPSASVVKVALRELFTTKRVDRVPEPDLVMDDPEKVLAFTQAGTVAGVMAPVYLFHSAQICEVLRPGDTAIDLGCGPATQLAAVARLNPQTHFVGVDLSEEMLDRASAHIEEERLTNVEFSQDDITLLEQFKDGSADAIFSTVALHQLPDEKALEQVFFQIARVLKPNGGLYLVDFGRLKSAKSIEHFAYQYADRQPELFTLDYLYSLRAAFTKAEFVRLGRHYLPQCTVSSTFILPFMVAVKSNERSAKPSDTVIRELEKTRAEMPDWHQTDFNDLKGMFRLGGLKTLAL